MPEQRTACASRRTAASKSECNEPVQKGCERDWPGSNPGPVCFTSTVMTIGPFDESTRAPLASILAFLMLWEISGVCEAFCRLPPVVIRLRGVMCISDEC